MSVPTGSGVEAQAQSDGAAPTPTPKPCPGGDVPREGSRDIHQRGRIISVAYDWCKSMDSPVAYRIWAWQSSASNLANTVRQTDCRSHVMGSIVNECYGDEPGQGGGVESGTHLAECTPMTASPTVRAEGKPMVRYLDKWWMNHKNTWGCLNNSEDMGKYDAPKVQAIQPKMDPTDASYQASADGQGTMVAENLAGGTATDAAPSGGTTSEPGETQLDKTINATPPYESRGSRSQLQQTLDTTQQGESTETEPASVGNIAKGAISQVIKKVWKKAIPVVGTLLAIVEPSPLDTVRVTKRDNRRECECIIDEYKRGETLCNLCHGNFHHIVPDMVYRTKERPEKEVDKNSTANRIPNAPTFNQGMSVCIDAQDHSGDPEGLHGNLRGELKSLTSTVAGTAPIVKVIGKSKSSLDEIKGLSNACKAAAKKAVDAQVRDQKLQPSQPARTLERPLPNANATTKMLQGHY